MKNNIFIFQAREFTFTALIKNMRTYENTSWQNRFLKITKDMNLRYELHVSLH